MSRIKFIDFYKRVCRIKRNKNVKELINAVDLREKWVITKIKNHEERWNLGKTVGDYLDDIKDNEYAQMMFAKKPSTQNLSEKCQKAFLKGRANIKILHKDAVRFEGVHKSMDFQSLDNPNEYWLAKVRLYNGGAQSSTKDEMKDAARALSISQLDKKFIFLLDGDEWTESELNEIKEYESNRIVITNSDDYGKERTS